MPIQTNEKDLYGDSGLVVAFWAIEESYVNKRQKLIRLGYVPYVSGNTTKEPLADKMVCFTPHVEDFPFDVDPELQTKKGFAQLVAYLEGLIVSAKYNPQKENDYAKLNPFYGLNPQVVA